MLLPFRNITVYHMFKAMTEHSDYDIAFIRKGKESSGTAQNILRRWTKPTEKRKI